MVDAVWQWLDERLQLGTVLRGAEANLRKRVPSHVNWFFTIGAVLIALLSIQMLTGVLLMAYYKPSSAEAYASIERITVDVTAGWLVRSLHAWGSHLIVILCGLHMLRVFVYGGYKKPRETNWILGVLLLAVIAGFGFTGYLLPWDQVAYWGTVVGTQAPTTIPLIGPFIGEFMVGGSEVADATLGRFFVLHVILLPVALIALMSLHLFLLRFQGISPLSPTDQPEPSQDQLAREGGESFFPNHALRDLASSYLFIGILATLALLYPPTLGEPADPLNTPPGIKPEWYFLPAYQLLKYVPEALGVQAPPLFLLLLILLPLLLDRSPDRHPRKRLRVLVSGGVLLAIILILGILGHVSETTRTFMGRAYHFDILGRPTETTKLPTIAEPAGVDAPEAGAS